MLTIKICLIQKKDFTKHDPEKNIANCKLVPMKKAVPFFDISL